MTSAAPHCCVMLSKHFLVVMYSVLRMPPIHECAVYIMLVGLS